ncbi:MAG: hypothetical protein ACOCV1_07785 [Bacillota bacterium]
MKKVIYFLILILIFSPAVYADFGYSDHGNFGEWESGSFNDYSSPGSFYDHLKEKYEYKVPDYFDHEVIIPIKIVNYFGFANYHYLSGKPRAKIQFGDDFEYLFKLNSKIGLILTDQEVKAIKAKNKFLTLDEIISRGSLIFKEENNSPFSGMQY